MIQDPYLVFGQIKDFKVNPNLNLEPVKTAFFSVNPNRTWTLKIWFRWTRTGPEALNFGATEPEPSLNPNFWKVLNLNWTVKNKISWTWTGIGAIF